MLKSKERAVRLHKDRCDMLRRLMFGVIDWTSATATGGDNDKRVGNVVDAGW